MGLTVADLLRYECWMVLGHYEGRTHEFVINCWTNPTRAWEALERARNKDGTLRYRVAHVVEQRD